MGNYNLQILTIHADSPLPMAGGLSSRLVFRIRVSPTSASLLVFKLEAVQVGVLVERRERVLFSDL